MIASRSALIIAAAALSLDAHSFDSLGSGSAATIQSLQLSDTSVTGGNSVTATLALTSLASASGDTVTISSFPRGVGHAATVVVPKGHSQTTFTLTTTPTATTQQFTITATAGASQKSVSLSVRRPAVRSVALSSSSIQGGRDTLWMTVALDGVAPSGGIPFSVISGPPGLATVGFPPNLTNPQIGSTPPTSEVLAGASQVVVPLRTPAVRLTRTVVVVADGKSATFELRQPPVNVVFYLSSDCSVSGSSGLISGPRTLRGYVTVHGPLPSNGAFVSLTSSSPAAIVPASVDITRTFMSVSSGITYFDCFDIQLQPVAVQTPIVVTASAGGSVKHTNFVIHPRTLSSLIVADELVRAGQMITLSVSLSAPGAPGGTVVSLTSSNPAAVAVPASITVLETSLAAGANVLATLPASHPDLATGVIITASFAGRTLADTVIVRR